MDFSENRKVLQTSSIESLNECRKNDDASEFFNAYFEERRDSKFFLKNDDETDRDSSIGVIDIDTVSVFNEEEGENEMKHFRLSEHDFKLVNRYSQNIKNEKESDVGKSEAESELDKQRALAQQALQRCTNDDETTILTTSEKRESAALSDISSKFMNFRLSKGTKKDWFQPKVSPKTPRYFNDELSVEGEDENIPPEIESRMNKIFRKSLSLYDKKGSSIFKDNTIVSVNSEMEFESQTAEEKINRLEEDEKKFKLEKSGVLHNSQLSQFSGIAGDVAQWRLETSNSETEYKNTSIGEFFKMRSGRLSSLVGSAHVKLESNSLSQYEASTLSNSQEFTSQEHSLRKSKCSFSVSDVSRLNKQKVRRCVSTDDLTRASEVLQSVRYSIDSRSSNTTLFVQQMITNMKSGMSGDEINDMLLGSYEKRKEERKKDEILEKFKKILENKETPKSSKVQKRKESLMPKKEPGFSEACNESKKSPDEDSVVCLTEGIKETKSVRDLKSTKTSPFARSDKVKKRGLGKCFYSSTPKNQDMKSDGDKFRKNCGKVLMDNEDWEPPRVSSFRPIDLNTSEDSEEKKRTILLDSTGSVELNSEKTAVAHNAFSVEDSLVTGDLTILSHRIEQLKRDSVCIVRSAKSEEPVLLKVIQKLADLPKGSLDCSALAPLLKDQFPELLSNFTVTTEESAHSKANENVQDELVALTGSWIKLPRALGLKEKIYAFADSEKIIDVLAANVSSEMWLIVSIESVELIPVQGQKLTGERKDNEWWIQDFVVISLRKTIIPPDMSLPLKISFRAKVPTKVQVILDFRIEDIISEEVQTRNLRLFVNSIPPQDYVNVLPNDLINFGVIPDQCFDHRVVQISFDGICELPLMVYIEPDAGSSERFILKPSSGHAHEKEFCNNMCYHVFCEGEKQILELRILFHPNVLLKEDCGIQDFKASLVLMLGRKTDSDGILRKIPIKGSAGFARILCFPKSSPLVFKAYENGQAVTRPYNFKNVGSIPIEFSMSIKDEDGKITEEEDVFVFPKSFYLARNEEGEINITFNARGNQNFIKRFLTMQFKPNGKIIYETELIGTVTVSENSRPSSRTSGASVSTKSTANSDSASVKLLTTSQSLSWAAVALEKEARQTFIIKSFAPHTMSVRISFERHLEAFKLVNSNGEKVKKLRKVLKPDTPCPLTVIFRPDVVGAHNTSLTFETGHPGPVRKILLNGIGGTPNLLMENVKSDLNGCKILKLSHSHTNNQYENIIKFTNQGRIPAFVFIQNGLNEFSLCHDLDIEPRFVVVHPDSSIEIKISQKLKNEDLQQLLSDREIRKIATLCVTTGDEPSRLRIRKLIMSGILQPSERLNLFTKRYHDEKEMQLKNFKDAPGFETEFLRSLINHEIAVVVERNDEIPESSVLEETTGEFFSFLSEQTVIARGGQEKQTKELSSVSQKSTSSIAVINTSPFSAEILKSPSHKRVTKWLETLECV